MRSLELILFTSFRLLQKEASETNYWLRLFRDSEYLTDKLADSLLIDCDEIQRLLAASIKTAKTNLRGETKSGVVNS